MSDLQNNIKAAIGKVSTNFDLWTEDHASIAYFGIVGQWIDTHGLKPAESKNFELKCVMRSEVLMMHGIPGKHNRANLGRYLLKFSNDPWITSKTGTNKVSST